jgi:hypothetical protein
MFINVPSLISTQYTLYTRKYHKQKKKSIAQFNATIYQKELHNLSILFTIRLLFSYILLISNNKEVNKMKALGTNQEQFRKDQRRYIVSYKNGYTMSYSIPLFYIFNIDAGDIKKITLIK